ncbi:MAG: hypothetical protein NVSMB65_02030 [Chloroflexota bacterium]
MSHRVAPPPHTWFAVWFPAGPLPLAGELCAYLWGAPDATGQHIAGEGDPAWSPSWTRLIVRQAPALLLDVQVGLVDPDGTVRHASPWDRDAGGRPISRRLRDIATVHRERFRRVLARGFETLALVEARDEVPERAARVALCTACELARVTGGVVVDSTRNIAAPDAMADRHHLRETVVAWLGTAADRGLQPDAEGIVTIRCRMLPAPFGRPPAADARPIGGLNPRWWLAPLAPEGPRDDPAGQGGATSPAPARARGRMVALAGGGAYQASVDVRHVQAGDRCTFCVEPGDPIVGVRDATLPVVPGPG